MQRGRRQPLLTSATRRIWLYANASLFLPEDNLESIGIIRRKAETGTDARILMADPDSEVCAQRGVKSSFRTSEMTSAGSAMPAETTKRDRT